MMRSILVVLTIAVFAATAPYAAAINIDSTIAEWDAAGLLRTDITHGSDAVNLQRWGATVEDGYLYAIMENDASITDFSDVWADIWVNADQNMGTQMDNINCWPLTHYGTDIYADYWYHNNGGEEPPDHTYIYYGKNHANGDGDTGYPDGRGASVAGTENWKFSEVDNTVLSLRIPLADLAAKTAEYNAGIYDPNVVLGDTFDVGVRMGTGEADISGSMVTVPEPSTLALLVAGLIGLLCYAWRKR